ncbi:DUF3795 domain-containing protein [bacterium]|nr:DUF3795 domain-containing protein [bacterium]
MVEKLAYCGLDCESCPIYIATKTENPIARAAMREDIARICFEKYGMNYTSEEITDCDGCRNDGRLFIECANCAIRACARTREVENCAFCDNYACEKLTALFETDPLFKENLEKIRAESE